MNKVDLCNRIVDSFANKAISSLNISGNVFIGIQADDEKVISCLAATIVADQGQKFSVPDNCRDDVFIILNPSAIDDMAKGNLFSFILLTINTIGHELKHVSDWSSLDFKDQLVSDFRVQRSFVSGGFDKTSSMIHDSLVTEKRAIAFGQQFTRKQLIPSIWFLLKNLFKK